LRTQWLNKHLGTTVVEDGARAATADSFEGIIIMVFAACYARRLRFKKELCARKWVTIAHKLSLVWHCLLVIMQKKWLRLRIYSKRWRGIQSNGSTRSWPPLHMDGQTINWHVPSSQAQSWLKRKGKLNYAIISWTISLNATAPKTYVHTSMKFS
jgi:hypothetical protein